MSSTFARPRGAAAGYVRLQHAQAALAKFPTLGQASFRYAFLDPMDTGEEDAREDLDSGLHDEAGFPVGLGEAALAADGWADTDGGEFIHLAKLGVVDPADILDAIDEIADRYLTDVEGDLIYLMRKGRRPVEISRILRIPECEVVRLRRNCFRKILVVFMYDYYRDKRQFLLHAQSLLGLNEKQTRILTMFFDYYGLRPIAEVVGTRPSNIHRTLVSIQKKLDAALQPDSPYRPFLDAFASFKYLNVVHRTPRGT